MNTQIEQTEWSNFFVTFTNGNRGRTLSIEVLDVKNGLTGVVASGQLLSADYDSVNKGDDVIISIGADKVDASHTVSGPIEVWRVQDENGEITALEIVAEGGDKTILSFQ
jgi:hypothetical protein